MYERIESNVSAVTDAENSIKRITETLNNMVENAKRDHITGMLSWYASAVNDASASVNVIISDIFTEKKLNEKKGMGYVDRIGDLVYREFPEEVASILKGT